MVYRLDRNHLKSMLITRIIFLSLIFLVSTFTIVMGYLIFLKMIYIPIIVSLIHIDLTVYLILSTIKTFKRLYSSEYELNGNILKTIDYSINLKDATSLKVYSLFGKIERIKIIVDDKRYRVILLDNDGLNILIKRILEAKQ